MKKLLIALALLAAAFVIGRMTAGGGDAVPGAKSNEAPASTWYCPMHPQIKLPDPGLCPICHMDLVVLEAGGDEGPRELVMSEAAKVLAEVETAPVRRRYVTRPVRMVGKLDFDETAVRTISARVAGRLDRLYVDYTGVPVQEGDHLVRLYSPELSTAQEELLAARARLEGTAGEASEFLGSSNRRAYETSREKLVLLGLSEAQVDELEERGMAEDYVLIRSTVSGVVTKKMLDEGAYVQTGTPIYSIANLESLWVRLDAYEQDLRWLRFGQPVSLEIEALPGETLEGRISYIAPFIDEATRTAKVRVNLDGQGGRLKPGMFVRAIVMSRLGAEGRVLDPYLAGKWVSPMHPEIVKDEPGQCDVCGMDLVRAEELGLVEAGPDEIEAPLVVPASAVLVTGRRAVAYVELAGRDRPTYEGREVQLGPRAGDEFIVQSGLEEGERVVVHGAFRIDSAMQIQAKPSMMSLGRSKDGVLSLQEKLFCESLGALFESYLALQTALADDEFTSAQEAAERLEQELAKLADSAEAKALPHARYEL
ncbi:MAG: efflux RND transporter periplasmic adaptor subunit, partial [Planctomycetota bacterium]